MGFSNSLEMECERKKGVADDSRKLTWKIGRTRGMDLILNKCESL